jgi:hypothetical protein
MLSLKQIKTPMRQIGFNNIKPSIWFALSLHSI